MWGGNVNIMVTKRFLRRNWNKHSRLGKGRKKKQVWRKPKGRHNKMREKQKGYPACVRIGYKQEEKEKTVLINNLKELEGIKAKESIILGKMGKRKKIEMVKKAQEKGIHISNVNTKKFLEKNEKKKKEEKKETKAEEKKK